MIQHILNFVTTGYGEIEIVEPQGFDGAEFVIEKDGDRRLGRDVFALGGSNQNLTIYNIPGHPFEQMRLENDIYGINANVKYILKIDGDVKYTGQVDFKTLETDDTNEMRFIVVEENEKAILKRRSDTNVNMFSYKDLDENPITPLQTTNVLVKSKPLMQVSEWTNPTVGQRVFADNPASNADYFMVIKNQVQYEILDSLNWLLDYNTDDNGGFKNFIFIDAKSNLSKVKIEFTFDAIYDYLPTFNNNLSGHTGQILLRVYYGQSHTSGNYTQINVWNSTAFSGNTNQQQILPTNIVVEIPYVKNTDKVWISFVSATKNGAVNRVTFNESSIKISASSTSYDTVVPMVRLIDAMKYVVKSSSGLNISAPRWEFGGQFYDQFISSQALMRGLVDKPFNWSFKELVDGYLPEVFGDYQIQDDGTVYFGIYEDFYRDYQVASFTDSEFGVKFQPIDGYSKGQNQIYNILNFSYKYGTYASQKESEQGSTYDEVHGETEWYNKNIGAENSYSIDVKVVRSAFSWETARRKAFTLSDDTATQDDDKIYILDVVDLTQADRQRTNTSELQHIDPDDDNEDNLLILKNDQSFGWLLLGIQINTPFQILSENNGGNYMVVGVTELELRLMPINPSQVLNSYDTDNTTYRYYIATSAASYVNRTSEGFAEITNISEGQNYSNLLFSVKRNILNYYSKYLASCAMWFKDNRKYKYLKSLYNNNPLAKTRLSGTGQSTIVEGDDFFASNPILTSRLYSIKLEMALSQFLDLMVAQREHNGYISLLDASGLPLKAYIKKASWKFLNAGEYDAETYIGEVTATVEEKYQQFLVFIEQVDDMILLNGKIIPSNFTFLFDEYGYVTFYSEVGEQLYPKVRFERVKVNNSGELTAAELAQLLNNING